MTEACGGPDLAEELLAQTQFTSYGIIPDTMDTYPILVLGSGDLNVHSCERLFYNDVDLGSGKYNDEPEVFWREHIGRHGVCSATLDG
jgi:hypothetical protein